MNYNPEKHRRQSIRKDGFDYTSPGGYFVTVCAHNKKHLFGVMRDGRMHLNNAGEAVTESWRWLAKQHEYIRLEEYCVMPNHFHGIIAITEHTGDSRIAPTVKSLGRLIGAFKTVSTKQINIIRGTSGALVWQRNYYDRIIRDGEWEKIASYIEANPAEWHNDRENPDVRHRLTEQPWQI